MTKNNELKTIHFEAHKIIKGDLIVEGEELLIAGSVETNGVFIIVITEDGPREYTANQIVTVLR